MDKKIKNNKKTDIEMKQFQLLSKKSAQTIVPCKGIHQIGIAFAANRLGECSTSLQIRACKFQKL